MKKKNWAWKKSKERQIAGAKSQKCPLKNPKSPSGFHAYFFVLTPKQEKFCLILALMKSTVNLEFLAKGGNERTAKPLLIIKLPFPDGETS